MERISLDQRTPGDTAMQDKNATVRINGEIDDSGSDDVLFTTRSTRIDADNMRRMGKKQQLVRRFRVISVACFAGLCTAAWELGLFMITPGLLDGGRPNLIYSLIWSFVGFGPIYLSMAEMASMAPICGSQYHWVSEFAPESMQRILSYITGWTTTLAWQAGNCLGVFLVGTLIQCLISINYPDYAFPAWHATLLVMASTAIAFIGNVFGSKVMAHWQTTVFAIHILGYFALIIPIWANAAKATHSQVWLEFENYGGWTSMPLSILVGQVAGIYAQVGVDTAAHMAEEVQDAASAVPRAMIYVYIINFVVTFPLFVTLVYHMPDLTPALDDPTLYPAIYVLRQSMSPLYQTLLLILIILLLIAGNISYLAAVTRDIFAFARDSGIPFSSWVAHIQPKKHIPQNACIVTSVLSVIMALLYLGSPVAFYAITSVCTVALLQSYCLSIGCILWRRIYHPETLPPSKFSLGRWGIPLNAIAVVYSFWAFFWTFWPQTYPVTAPDFNWAIVLFFGTIVVAGIDFVFRARKSYKGPVTEVRGRFNNAS